MGGTLGDQLDWQSWPSSGLNENFITRSSDADALEKYKASVARVAMYAGEPLRKSKLIGEGQSFMSSILPAGKRAIATQIAADTSAGGFILPNDYVDVIMTRRSRHGDDHRRLHHRNHPQEHPGPGDRPGDPGGRGGPQASRSARPRRWS